MPVASSEYLGTWRLKRNRRRCHPRNRRVHFGARASLPVLKDSAHQLLVMTKGWREGEMDPSDVRPKATLLSVSGR